MIKQYEIILTTLCLVLSVIFLTLFVFRIRHTYFKKTARVPIWNKKVGFINRLAKLTLALSLFFMAPGAIYFLFFILKLPSAVIRDFAKTIFCIIFSAWTLLEIFLCFSIIESLIKASRFKRFLVFGATAVCAAVAAYLFPLIPKSLSYPAAADCVILELPVRGKWFARNAGASLITNAHHVEHPYAIDILKLGPDNRLYKGTGEAVTDFYSYNAPVYAPADGRVVKVVAGLEGDRIGTYIIIDIGNGKYVFFAHLEKGSLEIDEDQFVKVGRMIGRVDGSGGFSGFPHLHMHVQNMAKWDMDAIDGLFTYPFRFRKMIRKRFLLWKEFSDGYLVRNDRFGE